MCILFHIPVVPSVRHQFRDSNGPRSVTADLLEAGQMLQFHWKKKTKASQAGHNTPVIFFKHYFLGK